MGSWRVGLSPAKPEATLRCYEKNGRFKRQARCEAREDRVGSIEVFGGGVRGGPFFQKGDSPATSSKGFAGLSALMAEPEAGSLSGEDIFAVSEHAVASVSSVPIQSFSEGHFKLRR